MGRRSLVAGVLLAPTLLVTSCGGGTATEAAQSTSSAESLSATSSSESTAATAEPIDLTTLLLDEAEIGTVVGLGSATVTDTQEAPDDVSVVDPPECHAIVYNVGNQEYDDSGYSAIRWQTLDTEQGGWVMQSVAQFPTAESAAAFVAEFTPIWQACVGKTVTDSLKDGTDPIPWFIEEVTPAAGSVTSFARDEGNPTGGCHRTLRAEAQIVVETNVCGDGVTDQGTALTAAIAERVPV